MELRLHVHDEFVRQRVEQHLHVRARFHRAEVREAHLGVRFDDALPIPRRALLRVRCAAARRSRAERGEGVVRGHVVSVRGDVHGAELHAADLDAVHRRFKRELHVVRRGVYEQHDVHVHALDG